MGEGGSWVMGFNANIVHATCTPGWVPEMDPLPVLVQPNEVHLFPFGPHFILWNFKFFPLRCCLFISFWSNMNHEETRNFSPSFICNEQTCEDANQCPTFYIFCLFFCLFLSLTQISTRWFICRKAKKLMQWVQQCIFRGWGVCLSTHW